MRRHEVDYALYLVTDPGLLEGRDVVEVAGRAIDGGVTVIQHRDKAATDERYLETARRLCDLCRDRGVTFIVNDRVHLVAELDADGVHVGQEDMALAQARAGLGPDRIIGVSVSTVDEAVDAQRGGADYLGISPVFSSPMKTDAADETGLMGLRRIREAVRIPLVGIGSLDVTNAADVIRNGADGVAVIRAILAEPDPLEAARRLVEQVRAGRSHR